MNLLSFGLALFGVLLNAAAQLSLKAGTNSLKTLVSPDGVVATVLRVGLQPNIVLGLACYAISLPVWIVVLSRVPVSVAYPLLSIGYVVNAFLAYSLFGEALGTTKLIGIGIIIVGVIILTRPGVPA